MDAYNVIEIYTRDPKGHLILWVWSQDFDWGVIDLSSITDLNIAGDPVFENDSWIFTRGEDDHLYQWVYTAATDWIIVDLTAEVGGKTIADDPVYGHKDNVDHLFVRGADGHLLEWWRVLYQDAEDGAWYSNGWYLTDLSWESGGKKIVGSPAYYADGGYQHVFAQSDAGHLLEWWWSQEAGWHFADLTEAVGGGEIAGNPVYFNDNGYQHIFVRGEDGHLLEWWWSQASGWHLTDLSEATHVGNILGDPAYYRDAGYQHVFARTDGGHLIEWWWAWESGWHVADLTQATWGQTISGDPAYQSYHGTQQVMARGPEGGLINFWWTLEEGWRTQNMLQAVEPGCLVGDDSVAQNQFIYDLMKEKYLWNDQMTWVPFDQYESPYAYLEAIQYKALDHWSFLMPRDEYQTYFNEDKYWGIGIAISYLENNNDSGTENADAGGQFVVKFVYRDSPADQGGIKRGDRLLAINGKTVATIQAQGEWDEIWGDDSDIPVQIELSGSEGTYDLTLYQTWVRLYPVLEAGMIVKSDIPRTGYLVFNHFNTLAKTDLNWAFDYFKEKAASELILDLRYNSGGYINIARDLSSYIVGNRFSGQVFWKQRYNPQQSDKASELKFVKFANGLDLSRVFILTSGETCSASEAIINGLRPYITIIQIGETTCGKPVGLSPYVVSDMVLLPVEVIGVNRLGQGAYYEGLSPTCQARETSYFPFGSLEDPLLNAALAYLRNGRCDTAKTGAPFLKVRQGRFKRTEKGGHWPDQLAPEGNLRR